MPRKSKATKRWFALAWASSVAGLGLAAGCATMSYPNEGPGQPSDRASGAVPAGSIGVCRRPGTKKPPIVSDRIWENARACNAKTPERFIRIGYSREAGKGEPDPEAEKLVARIVATLGQERSKEGYNGEILSMLRALRDYAGKEASLRDRVARGSARPEACDLAYLLNTMSRERAKLSPSACTAEAYDTKVRAETCIFDESSSSAGWLTSGWDCMTHAGGAESCHRLCGYDDYCARQVSCAVGDVDLVLCALGVCLPEARLGLY